MTVLLYSEWGIVSNIASFLSPSLTVALQCSGWLTLSSPPLRLRRPERELKHVQPPVVTQAFQSNGVGEKNGLSLFLFTISLFFPTLSKWSKAFGVVKTYRMDAVLWHCSDCLSGCCGFAGRGTALSHAFSRGFWVRNMWWGSPLLGLI